MLNFPSPKNDTAWRLLIVDDEPIRQVLAYALNRQGYGYRFAPVYNGQVSFWSDHSD